MLRMRKTDTYFNSRPRERPTKAIPGKENGNDISTHDLVRGRRLFCGVMEVSIYFNSRPRERPTTIDENKIECVIFQLTTS